MQHKGTRHPPARADSAWRQRAGGPETAWQSRERNRRRAQGSRDTNTAGKAAGRAAAGHASRPCPSARRYTSSRCGTREGCLHGCSVYDLLPEGRFADVSWAVGLGIYHSGVVVAGQEWAYGGHGYEGATGVYSTLPRHAPPGARFRESILHGFCYESSDRINRVIDAAKREFLGSQYDMLSRNCNHFTSYLCQKLVGSPAPSWLNRGMGVCMPASSNTAAASIGMRIPCVVPSAWIEPPLAVSDDESVEGGAGRLSDSGDDERQRMLPPESVAPMMHRESSHISEASAEYADAQEALSDYEV